MYKPQIKQIQGAVPVNPGELDNILNQLPEQGRKTLMEILQNPALMKKILIPLTAIYLGLASYGCANIQPQPIATYQSTSGGSDGGGGGGGGGGGNSGQ